MGGGQFLPASIACRQVLPAGAPPGPRRALAKRLHCAAASQEATNIMSCELRLIPSIPALAAAGAVFASTGCWVSVATPAKTPVAPAATAPAAAAPATTPATPDVPPTTAAATPDVPPAAPAVQPLAQPAVQPLAQPAAPAPQAGTSDQVADSGRFSVKRMVVEALAGEATSIALTLAMCNGSSCTWDGWAPFLASFAISPIAVYGTGHAMGGRGSMFGAYAGATAALAPLTIPTDPMAPPDQVLSQIQTEATISAVLLPLCSALTYEVTSHVASVAWQREHQPALAVQPLYSRGQVQGGAGTFSFRF